MGIEYEVKSSCGKNSSGICLLVLLFLYGYQSLLLMFGLLDKEA